MSPLLPDLLIVEGEIIIRGKPFTSAMLRLRAKRRQIEQFIEKQTEKATELGQSYVYGTTIINGSYYAMPPGVTYIWPQWGSGNA